MIDRYLINKTTEDKIYAGLTVPANGTALIPPEKLTDISESPNILEDIVNNLVSISPDGVKEFTDVNEQINFLKGLYNEILMSFQDRHIDTNDRIKIAVSPDPHAVTHQDGGTDEIDVTDLSGVLSDQQHPIPSECVDAMGAKSDTNPLNHDKFKQTDIVNLPESQLDLNFPTHDNSNDPSTAEKQAMDNASSPSTTNPFATIQDLSNYSPVGHTHATLPTQDQKDALDAANTPSSTNPFLTMSDLPEENHVIVINSTTLLNRSGDPVGFPVKVLEDEDISGVIWEAGWYTKTTSGDGFNGSDWEFHSTREDHSHSWTDVSKVGSKLSDIEDVPGYSIVDGVERHLQAKDGTLSWATAETNIQKRTLTLNLCYVGSTNGTWLRFGDNGVKLNESGWTPPFNCRVREVQFTNRYTGYSGRDVQIKCYYKNITNVNNITTSDSVEWYADSTSDSNLMYNIGEAKRWGKDLSTSNDIMLSDRAYALYVKKISGSGSMNDIAVTIFLEEV